MGTLFIVSTPIGNISDITIHAIDVLFTVSIIACEDTRITGNLLSLLEQRYSVYLPHQLVKRRFIKITDDNEEISMPTIIEELNQGNDVALVSDAGTPLISDPGYKVVTYARSHNIPITLVGGISALITALSGSGYPTDRFEFLGFLPEKQGKRTTLLESLANENVSKTYIIYVSPHKIQTTIKDMISCFGPDKKLCIARELTKIHEEFWYGSLEEATLFVSNPKGEYVLLLRGNLR